MEKFVTADPNRARNCRPLEEEPRSLALIDVLRLAALENKDAANAHVERLNNYYFSEIANAEAYMFMLEMEIDKSKAETVAAVCKLTFDLERCPHTDAPQTKAQLQINLCPGTVFEGYNVIHHHLHFPEYERVSPPGADGSPKIARNARRQPRTVRSSGGSGRCRFRRSERVRNSCRPSSSHVQP